MAESRTQSFQAGSTDHFIAMVHAGQNKYQNRSVLDQYLASGNGMAIRDRSRLAPGGNIVLGSQNGASKDTYSSRQWLDTPYRTLG